MGIRRGALGASLSRRRFLSLIGGAAVLASSGLLAACGGEDDDSDTSPAAGESASSPTTSEGSGTSTTPATDVESTPSDTTPEADEPTTVPDAGGSAPSGELIVAALQDDYLIEPNRANIGQYPLNANVFESLVRLAPDFQIEPVLAESWEFVEPNTWRFVLREGVTFHDGTPFTAEAVQWSMGRVAARGGGTLGLDENSVEIIDDLTVEITPVFTNLRVVQQICHPQNSIVAPNSEPAELRVGTGPFKEAEYQREERYVVEANDDYWGDAPKLSKITFRFIPDATTRVLALQSGEVDLVFDVPRESADALANTSGYGLITSDVGAYQALSFLLHGEEPYDLGGIKEIREAIAYAVDKEAIVNGVFQGHASLNNTMIPEAILGTFGEMITGAAYDADRARQILDDAGWVEGSGGIREKDGRQLKLEIVVRSETGTVMPEFVQAQLLDVGIDLEIVVVADTAGYEARILAREFDISAGMGNQNDGNPCFLPDLLYYSPDPDGDPESQMYRSAYAPGAAFDAHIDDCRATAVTTEEIQEAAANAMKILIDDEFVVIPLAGTFRIYGISDAVEGFEAHPSNLNQLWTNIALKG